MGNDERVQISQLRSTLWEIALYAYVGGDEQRMWGSLMVRELLLHPEMWWPSFRDTLA